MLDFYIQRVNYIHERERVKNSQGTRCNIKVYEEKERNYSGDCVRCDTEDFSVHSSNARMFSSKEASMMFNKRLEQTGE